MVKIGGGIKLFREAVEQIEIRIIADSIRETPRELEGVPGVMVYFTQVLHHDNLLMAVTLIHHCYH